MQPFQIFRPGRHTASSGTALQFSEADLEAAVAAYDPTVHEAPIVVGHPRDNGPAYGWVKALSYADGAMVAEPQQVDPDFAEMVQAGRFKKRSASFYTPDSPHNPKPGAFYLRHVGFLGAQAPAVKGLKDVAFSDADEGVVEFADNGVVAGLFRRLRDWFLSEHGAATADNVLPGFLVEDLEVEARAERDKPMIPATSFSEDETMTEADKAALDAATARADAAEAKVAELEAKIAQQSTDFSERETALQAREAAIAKAEVEGRLDKLVAAGKVLPAEKAALAEFAMTLSTGEAVLEFGEGDAKTKLNPRDYFLATLDKRPKAVEFGERAGETGEGKAELTNEDVAEKARAFRDEQRAKGKTISFTEAVVHVREQAAG